MSFENLMGEIARLGVAADTLAAIGARLTLGEGGPEADPNVSAALDEVLDAAGVADLGALQPPQRAAALTLSRLLLAQATDLAREPRRPAGWAATDPLILDGYGRLSMMIPGLVAGAAPELAGVRSFLDVGTGVGLLAVAAAGVWPDADVVGVDVWEPSLERARANIAEAGLAERVTVREQDAAELADVEAFDCTWLPTFFFRPEQVEAIARAVLRATRPGGWIVLGYTTKICERLPRAASRLHTVRGGGEDLSGADAESVLKATGWTAVRTLERRWPMPVDFVIGQRG
jgi:SAM-dependent methyltransferase